MESCSAIKVPMRTFIKLAKDEDEKSMDVTMYKGLISLSLYLTVGRPNRIFFVGICVRF